MKTNELVRYKKFSLGTYDDGTFVISTVAAVKEGDKAGKKILAATYFYTSLLSAMKKLSRMVSSSEAKDLSDYMTIYAKTVADLTELCRPVS